MKISLAWVFDHIDADWRSFDAQHIVNLFNKTTAEIERFDKISLPLDQFAAAKVKAVNSQIAIMIVPEWNHTIDLPTRETMQLNEIYLIKKIDNSYSWLEFTDLASEKPGLFPMIKIDDNDLSGAWKKKIEKEDIILHVDNKSINNRPDLWCHRGIACEIAAMLQLPFKAIDHLLIKMHLAQHQKDSTGPISISLQSKSLCQRYAGLYLPEINMQASRPWMAFRLARVDAKPINAIVDATNYVMFDLGQPMHAFDAATIKGKKIAIRKAKNKEKIVLLDGQEQLLINTDCVIADEKNPIALAGIMGDAVTGVSQKTNSIFLESACFNPSVIRKTTIRTKKRTESSARFEKALDPNSIELALFRFLKLLDDEKIKYTKSPVIDIVGSANPIKKITIRHSLIEAFLGVTISPEFVINTLQRLEFACDYKKGRYSIVIPSFRAVKDITIKEDIIEEIGRFYGYDAIAAELPAMQRKPFDINSIMHMRAIKQFLSFGLDMIEVQSYAFFDESFLQTIEWEPEKTLQVREAVSENWRRLTTSLIPNLLHVVHKYRQQLDQMNFFESAAIWPLEEGMNKEKNSLAGIFVDQKRPIDFYQSKEKIEKLANLLNLSFNWNKVTAENCPIWYLPHQTAYIYCNDKQIGIAGMANPAIFAKVAQGSAFIFEFDADFLTKAKEGAKKYKPLVKYSIINRDISMLVPLAMQVGDISEMIKQLDEKITDVLLIDFFQKKEWTDQKSLTFRISFSDPIKQLETAQIDLLMQKINQYLQSKGAIIR